MSDLQSALFRLDAKQQTILWYSIEELKPGWLIQNEVDNNAVTNVYTLFTV